MIRVVKAPPYLTVQDRGRFGHRASGVPPSGAMDVRTADTLNAVVGNGRDAAVLEWAIAGGTLRFDTPATIALGGLFFAADLGSWHLGILRTKLANATLFGNSTSLIFPIYGFVIARAWPTRAQALALTGLILCAVPDGLLARFGIAPPLAIGDGYWRWFLNLGSYATSIVLLVCEYAFRRWYLRDIQHASLPVFVSRLVRADISLLSCADAMASRLWIDAPMAARNPMFRQRTSG